MTQTKLYKFHKNLLGNVNSVTRKGETLSDGKGYNISSIPFDPENTDYQEYLKWVAAGNTAEAAD